MTTTTPDPTKPFETDELFELRASQRRLLLNIPSGCLPESRQAQLSLPDATVRRASAEMWVRRAADSRWTSVRQDDEIATWLDRLLDFAAAKHLVDQELGGLHAILGGHLSGLARDLDATISSMAGKIPGPAERALLEIVPYLDLADQLAGDGFRDPRI